MKRLCKQADINQPEISNQENIIPTKDIAPANNRHTNNVPDEQNSQSVEDAQTILNRIDEASDNLKDVYYALFDNLNALFEAYPNLYKQMQMVIKLPTNDDATNVVKFHDGLHQVLEHFKDPLYLETYIDPPKPDDLRGADKLNVPALPD